MTRLLPLAMLIVLTTTAASAGPDWTVRTLESPGAVGPFGLEDLDGDGTPEVLFVSGRTLRIHPAGSTRPSLIHEFEPSALVFCARDVDANPKTREIVYLRRGGVAYCAFVDGKLDPKPRTLIETKDGLLEGARTASIRWRKLGTDLADDGFTDIIFPTRRGYRVYPGRPHDAPVRFGPDHAFEIPTPLLVSVEAGGTTLLDGGRYSEGVPDWTSGDFDGDGHGDLALLPEGKIEVYRGDGKGFSAKPDFWIDLTHLQGESGLVRPSIADINRDGIPDLMANEPWQGRTTIFLGRKVETKGRVKLGAPTATRRVGGWSWEVRLEDLDGDDFPDLIIPHTEKVGAMEAAKVAVSGRFGVRNFVYLNTRDPKKPFRDDPDAIREIEVEVRLSLDFHGRVQIGHTKIASTKADFDGDGRKDLILQTDSEEISIYRGSAETVLSDRVWRRLAIPSTSDERKTRLDLGDVNGDGLPDVILVYESWDAGKDRVVLLVSER